MQSSDIESARAAVQAAEQLLEDARMVAAPPDCVAERERDLAAAKMRLRELEQGIVQPESSVSKNELMRFPLVCPELDLGIRHA